MPDIANQMFFQQLPNLFQRLFCSRKDKTIPTSKQIFCGDEILEVKTMKRRITFSIALALSLALLSLMRADSTVKAQPGGRLCVADTGIVTLGLNQELRVTVAAGDVNGDNAISVRFKQMEYMQTACIGGVCKYTVSSQTTTDPIRLMSSGAAIFLAGGNDSNNLMVARGVVLSNSRNLRVTAIVFDTSTQRVVALMETVTLTCE